MALGDAWIDVHANTDPFERELKRDLEKDLRVAGNDANLIMNEIGKGWGEHVSKSTAEEIKQRGPEFARAVEQSTVGKHVRMRWTYDYDKNGVLKGMRAIATEVENAVSDGFGRGIRKSTKKSAVSSAVGSGGGGLFSYLQSMVQDAIGAGFNVSGKSALTPLLGVAVADIVGLILGAVQAANSLVAVLLTVPGLLTAIGLQAGILFIAFHGMDKVIQEAFAAKNAKELKTALDKLGPAARGFVQELLGMRKTFREIRDTIQENFFSGFSGAIESLVAKLAPILKNDLGPLANTLGQFLKTILLFLASPVFTDFLRNVIISTGQWLNDFGPKLIDFLTGFIDISNSAIGFMRNLGTMLGDRLSEIGKALSGTAKDPDTQRWLRDMKQTLEDVLDLGEQVVSFIGTFADSLNKAGGDKIIKSLTDEIEQLTWFLSTPVGKEALKGFVELSIGAIRLTSGVITEVLLLFAGIEWAWQHLWPVIKAAAEVIVGSVKAIIEILEGLYNLINLVTDRTSAKFVKLKDKTTESMDGASKAVNNFPGQVAHALDAAGDIAETKGGNFISRLAAGIKNMAPALNKIVERIAAHMGGYFGSSPAKYGPLSGSGWMEPRGKRLMNALSSGIEKSSDVLNSTVSNAATSIALGAVNLNFYGQKPTEQDARRMGTVAGLSVATQLGMSQANLAIRSI